MQVHEAIFTFSVVVFLSASKPAPGPRLATQNIPAKGQGRKYAFTLVVACWFGGRLGHWKNHEGRGYGFWLDIVLGIVGAFVGGFIAGHLGFSPEGGLSTQSSSLSLERSWWCLSSVGHKRSRLTALLCF